MLLALTIFGWATAILWLLAALLNVYMMTQLPRLDQQRPPRPPTMPRLSVIIAACNEAETIEPAFESLLAETYPQLEIIIVDDRSTDGTSEIVDRMAAEDPRIKAIHVKTLADGWLGKLAALDAGVKAATGEWLLFTDADVHFVPGALEQAIAYAEAERADHICLFPRLHSESFVVDLMVAAAVRVVGMSQKPWRAKNPKAKETLGAGAFNLVRRSAYDRTPGFEWLKMEVADDIGLAQMLKAHGAIVRVVIGTSLVSVEWYRSVRDAFRGLEKNAFAQMARYSLLRAIVFVALSIPVSLGPFLALFIPELRPIAAIAYGAHVLSSVIVARFLAARPLAMILAVPFGDLLMTVLLLRAAVLGRRRGGLLWRGTLYPIAALKAGARVKF